MSARWLETIGHLSLVHRRVGAAVNPGVHAGQTSCIALAMWLVVAGHWSLAKEVASPLSPTDAQREFRLADDSLRIELAAAEPEVVDPVAIRFDEYGRMWVAEMRDYPLGPPGGGLPLSRIRVLEDRDGDGRYESATTFADHLSFVTGLQPWKGGAFVTLSGAVAYMKDTDGDGKCDLDETWFEGFAEQNTQLRANHPRLALDDWIYVANGLRGGKIVSRKFKDHKTIDISGMDFRFDPFTGKAEAVSGNGQFGLCFDDWGNRFTCTNRNPCRHVVIEDRYLKASPGVTVPAVMHDVAAFAENSRIYPISRAWTTSNLHAGQFTAACGVHIYRGDLLPEEFRGNVFTCDPTGNLIHREIMQPAGPTFTSRPAYEGKEFLASPDEWFRPVNLELGPDGAMYVVDMYRCVIEHPDFVPDELKQRPDLRLGDDRGRIWRIVPAKVGPSGPDGPELRARHPSLKLSVATSDNLVLLLDHPNAWQREAAQRLLIERERLALAPKLRELLSTAPQPRARLAALWLLHGLQLLEAADVETALQDHESKVRRQGMILVESLEPEQATKLRGQLTELAHDANGAVRFQASLAGITSGFFERVADVNDPWMRSAASLHYGTESGAALWVYKQLRPDKPIQPYSSGQLIVLETLSELAMGPSNNRERDKALHRLALALMRPEGSGAGIAGLSGALRGLAKRGIPIGGFENPYLSEITQRLAELAVDDKLSSDLRLKALDTLGYLPDSAAVLVLHTQRNREQSVRVAAINALSRTKGTDHWQPLMEGLASDTPTARRAILDGLLANAERTTLLLDAIAAGKLKPSELDQSQVKRLVEHRDPAIKKRAAMLVAAALPQDRVKVMADYQPVLSLKSDPQRGQAIFEKNCAACHKIAGIGVNVAPDISDSRTKTAAQILADILQPNRAIDNNYLGYSVRLLDGTVASGILVTETATSITLRQQGGKELVLARSEIDELKSSGISLMPEGLERQLPPQDMADLLAFIKHWRYLDGRTPLGPPPTQN